MSSLEVNGITIELSRKRIKNLILRINPEGHVKVSAPLRCSLETIHTFLHNKQAWIDSHLARLQARPIRTALQLMPGDDIFFLGKAYTLQMATTPHANIILDDSFLYLPTHAETSLAVKQNLLTRWYKQQMRALLPALIQKWEPLIGVHAHEWGIRAMKTRWGSCNTVKKRICLNLVLIHHPIECIEYVLVHELVHLLEASHNARFHALMDQFMPEWKLHKQTLRKHASNLPSY